jgi:signal transduction histidine kinase
VERLLQIQTLLLRSRRLPWVILSASLVILGGAIVLTTAQTRARIRAQLAGRDGEILHAVAQMQQPAGAETEAVLGSMDDPANQLSVVLQISRLGGVMGARLFDADGTLIAPFPEYVLDGTLTADDLDTLKRAKPVSHFRPAVALSEVFLPESPDDREERDRIPILEVNVPLVNTGRRLAGVAQFIIEGHSIAREFARLDRNLLRQALAEFLVGGLILLVTVGWSFRRLNRVHRLLAERTANLLKANQELALAAKTSAVGAVTSHLIHGLRNPLAGLQNFVAGLGSAVADHPDVDLQQAIAATRRMQTMINDVVSVLRQEEGAGQYEITLTELMELIAGKVQSLSRQAGVELVIRREAEAVLPSRVANLVAMILVNLVQNAIQATPRGKTVTMAVGPAPDGIACEVRDEGLGFPEDRHVFAPCQSTKEGASGIGLAISKQLANHLGAGLELKRWSGDGCLFVLTLPASLWREKTSSVTLTLG